MRILALFLFIVVSLESYASSVECKDFFSSKSLQYQISSLKRLKTTNFRSWLEYDLNSEIVIFTDIVKSPTCFVLVNKAQIVRTGTLEKQIVIPNTIYDFLYLKSSNLPNEFRSEMLKIDKKDAIIVSLHDWEFIPNYIRSLVGENALVFNLLAHEAFHLFYQRRARVEPNGKINWPDWLEHPEHEKVEKNCYKHPAISNAYRKELNALVRSAQLLSMLGNKDAALEAALKFISSREERYKLLVQNNITVPLFSDEISISCMLAEQSLEIDEGITNYVGSIVSLNLNLISNFQFIEFSRLFELNPYFYGAGQLQLFILKSFLSQIDFDKVKTNLSDSKTPSVNVFTLFKSRIEAL
ncbi:MAG: hypothetical protein AB8E15_03035 [Bdellovibrionales bacterium]